MIRSSRRSLTWLDVGLLALLALLFYGPAIWGHRPLSVHEARLPQLAREMVWFDGDWLLPTSGGRPWLERPPLPHWATAVSMMFFGGSTNSLSAPRMPTALCGFLIGWLAAWMAARWFGRGVGLLAGLVTISSYEIYQYATLAEDDIYLGLIVTAAMALFVRARWPINAKDRPLPGNPLVSFLSLRPWHVTLSFVLLGLTNLVKGPLVGAMPVFATVGILVLLDRDWKTLRRIGWLWGGVIFLALTLAWPVWAWKHYPDVVANWRYDILGQSEFEPETAAKWNEPAWYYLTVLPLSLAPWTWATVIGLIATAGKAWRRRGSPYRFIWCWAFVSLLLLSAAARKHHHYLVPTMVPWAILSTLGLVYTGRWLAARAKAVTLPRLTTTVLAGCVIAGGFVQLRVAGRDDRTLAELDLMSRMKKNVPPGEPVFINADTDSLRFFRLQYTIRRDSHLIQNLSFLLSEDLNWPELFVLTKVSDLPYLRRLGQVKELDRTAPSRKNASPGSQFAIFSLKPFADLPRTATLPAVGVL
ncbi:MAG: glycosyltransferase family 39 protein [Tepidisphaeraceae bacterium]